MHGMQRINASGADVFISQNCFAWGKNWIWIEQKVFGTWWTVYFIFKRIEKFKMHQLLSPSELVRLFWWRKKYFGLLRLFFRELRSHFVDVAVAHEAGCHKLDDLGKVSLQWILSKLTDYMEFFLQNLKGFQRELSDTILLHRSLLEEVSRSATVEKAGVQQFCQQILDKLLETRDTLLNQIDM